jgi:glycosyltransferase involved in cell wall biosynthesis
MHRGRRVAAVLPAFNEARYVAAAVERALGAGFDDVIVVDDASTDDTAVLARTAGASLVETLPENRGVGFAIKSGWTLALERGADLAVVVPGDGQADLDSLDRLLDRAIDGSDLVIGDRISGRDPRREGMPRVRLLGSRGLAFLTWVSTGVWVPDPQSGYQVVTRRLLTTVRLSELADRWGTHNDLISHCALAGLPVATVPVKPVYFTVSGERFASHWRMADVMRRNLAVQRRALGRRVRQALGRRFYPRPAAAPQEASKAVDSQG